MVEWRDEKMRSEKEKRRETEEMERKEGVQEKIKSKFTWLDFD